MFHGELMERYIWKKLNDEDFKLKKVTASPFNGNVLTVSYHVKEGYINFHLLHKDGKVTIKPVIKKKILTSEEREVFDTFIGTFTRFVDRYLHKTKIHG